MHLTHQPSDIYRCVLMLSVSWRKWKPPIKKPLRRRWNGSSATWRVITKMIVCLKSAPFKVELSNYYFIHSSICLRFHLSKLSDFILWIRHWPQVFFTDGREHFPHVLPHQGEQCDLGSVSFRCSHPLLTAWRHDGVICVAGWVCPNVPRQWQTALHR